MSRSPKQIIDETNELARMFYARLGYNHKAGYRFDEATHPTEVAIWDMACMAQDMLTETDVMNALSDLED